jgi:hypothetical protein
VARKPRQVWHPPDYGQPDIRAIQALAQGTASEDEQKRALDWIINNAAATYDEPFRPGETDTVNYMLGRRSVGLAIVKLMKLKPKLFREKGETD